ncbi:hypothetical protein [Sorangium sp. So ce1099]|uniref:hypothetical protein n=1 Tax=Sorangium sp. So ce1099 TaxID=3133331 RepID=UPI003F6002B0
MDDLSEAVTREMLRQLFGDAVLQGLDYVQGLMNDLSVGTLSSSPLVAVTAADEEQLTVLIRGAMQLPIPCVPVGVGTFVRLEVVVKRDLDLGNLAMPLRVMEWRSFIAEVTIEKPGTFLARTGLGRYVDATTGLETWVGRGQLRLDSVGFGLDIVLGGLNRRGIMFGIDVELPVPIPLGNTGIGLQGFGGDFAVNFKPRLEGPDGQPILHPTARDFVTWAGNHRLDRWQPAALAETTFGLAARTIAVTLMDNGTVIALKPVGFCFLVTGSSVVLIVGGTGLFLKTACARIEAYLAAEFAAGSLALGGNIDIQYPPPKVAQQSEDWADVSDDPEYRNKSEAIIRGTGLVEAFFSFRNPELFFLNAGTRRRPMRLFLWKGLVGADVFHTVDVTGTQTGVELRAGGAWKYGPVRIVLRAFVRGEARLGWNPFELAAIAGIELEAGVSVLGLALMVRAEAWAAAHLPRPTEIYGELALRISLGVQLDIPPIRWRLSDQAKTGPALIAPLRAGHAWDIAADAPAGLHAPAGEERARRLDGVVGAIHAQTNRQWALTGDAGGELPWPDLQIVVPFANRVIDRTGLVRGAAVQQTLEGGYLVAHGIDRLRIVDLVRGTEVQGVGAAWAAHHGDTARLHVLADEPFAWLTPHPGTGDMATETPPAIVEQDFGVQRRRLEEDPDKVPSPFDGPLHEHFGNLVVESPGAVFLHELAPQVPTRVLAGHVLIFAFRTPAAHPVEGDPGADQPHGDESDTAIAIDHLELALIVPRGTRSMRLEIGPRVHTLTIPPDSATPVYESLERVVVPIPLEGDLRAPLRIETVADSHKAKAPRLLVVAVRFRASTQPLQTWKPRTVLLPGRYRLDLAGSSTAVHAQGVLPPSKPIAWAVQQEFEVTYPSSLRPYIAWTTIGDARLFGSGAGLWDPTPDGVGFPVYRSYLSAIRFNVPHLRSMFHRPLIPRLRFDSETPESEHELVDVTFGPNAAGESSLPAASQAWIRSQGGAPPVDDELAFLVEGAAHGRAALRVYFDRETSDGPRFARVEELACEVSRFRSFSEHVAWPAEVLTTFYGSGGRYQQAFDGFQLAGLAPAPTAEPLPRELDTAPETWRLSEAMARTLGPVSPTAPLRFLAFARLAGARFSAAGPPERGLLDVVPETAIHAVVDASGRPVALWLRAPEALDWRRVTALLKVEHVVWPAGAALAEGYAARTALELSVRLLPSTDGFSAFLVGAFGNVPVALPRGVFRLSLRFDAVVHRLPRLRPPGNTDHEVHTLVFLQGSGADWPTGSLAGRLDPRPPPNLPDLGRIVSGRGVPSAGLSGQRRKPDDGGDS